MPVHQTGPLFQFETMTPWRMLTTTKGNSPSAGGSHLDFSPVTKEKG
jgi:hypothetical protein